MDNVFRTSFYLVSHIPYHGAVLVGEGIVIIYRFAEHVLGF